MKGRIIGPLEVKAMEHTRRVAEFITGLPYDTIPPSAIAAAKGAILDSVGVALAGSRDHAARICAALVRAEDARQEAAVFGQGFRSSAMQAAFVNGTATHALDYDASFTTAGQPMAGLTPAVLALAEALGASGRELLAAYVAGYEVTAKLVWCTAGGLGAGGWHSTATVGSLGCAAAAARLLGLGVEQTAMALGIASCMAGGLVANFGTMNKPLHGGLAARNGVQAARLAQQGFTANPAILEARGGFVHTFGGTGSHDLKPLEGLGSRFEIEEAVKYKAYPCGGLTHSAVDAALALRSEHGVAAEAIDRIDVQVTADVARRIIFRIPATELQGKFSMPYIIARVIVDGRLTPDTFSDEAIRDPAVIALAERVQMEADPELERHPPGSRPSVVLILLKDGRSVSRRVDYPKGSSGAPFTAAELEEKFLSCARRALTAEAATEALHMIQGLESIQDLRAVGEVLMGGS